MNACNACFNYKDTMPYHANSLQQDVIKGSSIDLIITSPPYNVGIYYNTNKDLLSYEEYLTFCATWIKNCYFWAKSWARFCLNIPLDKNKGGAQIIGADLTTLKNNWLEIS